MDPSDSEALRAALSSVKLDLCFPVFKGNGVRVGDLSGLHASDLVSMGFADEETQNHIMKSLSQIQAPPPAPPAPAADAVPSAAAVSSAQNDHIDVPLSTTPSVTFNRITQPGDLDDSDPLCLNHEKIYYQLSPTQLAEDVRLQVPGVNVLLLATPSSVKKAVVEKFAFSRTVGGATVGVYSTYFAVTAVTPAGEVTRAYGLPEGVFWYASLATAPRGPCVKVRSMLGTIFFNHTDAEKMQALCEALDNLRERISPAVAAEVARVESIIAQLPEKAAAWRDQISTNGRPTAQRLALFLLSKAFHELDESVLRWVLSLCFGQDGLLHVNQLLPGWIMAHCVRTTVLHVALKKRLIHVVDLLLSLGASPDMPNGGGHAPLHVLCLGRREDNAMSSDDIEGAGADGLCRVAPAQKIAELLLSRGADPNLVDADGYPPLALAARQGLLGLVEALLTVRPAPPVAPANIFFKVPGEVGHSRTVLHFAAQSGVAGVVARLLDAGCQVNETDDTGSTPLDLARTTEVQRVLTDAGGTRKQRMCAMQ